MSARSLPFAALVLVGCAAAPAPATGVAAPTTPPGPRPAVAVNSPEVPEAPAASPPPVEGASAASSKELEEIARRFNEAGGNAIAGGVRSAVAPEAFRIEELPVITAPEPLDAAAAPTQASGDPATEITVDWKSSTRPLGPGKADSTYTSVRVSLSGEVAGKLRVGHSEATVMPTGNGGPFVSCGGLPSSQRKLVPARWEVVAKTPGGGLEYRVVNAWFDTQTCSASIVARASVTAQRLAGGMLYGLRQRTKSAADAAPVSEVLTLIGPRFSHLATGAVGGDAVVAVNEVTRVSVPIRRGGGASVLGRVAPSVAREWSNLTGVGPVADTDLVVGVEVTQGVEDPTPLAIAYVGASSAATKTAPAGQKGNSFGLFDPFLRK